MKLDWTRRVYEYVVTGTLTAYAVELTLVGWNVVPLYGAEELLSFPYLCLYFGFYLYVHGYQG